MRKGLGRHNRRSPGGFNPGYLFSGGIVAGAWYDPSDLSTLFQDSAGTTPVTAVEQVVGRMLDKSGRGNHATATGTARPTLSARVNLLTKTEEFQDAAWASSGTIAVTPNDAVAPNGTTTADKFNVTALNAGGEAGRSQTFTCAATQYTISWYVKPETITGARIGMFDGVNFGTRDFTFATKTFGNPRGTLVVGSTAYEELASGWYKLTITITASTASASAAMGVLATSTGTGWFWGADVRVANDGVNIPPYQRVNTATDYDTAGFPLYLSFAGAQAMSTPANIDFATVTSDGLARRNLLLNPTQFDVTTSWTTTRTTVTANTTVAPDGTTTAETVTATATTGFHYVNAGVDNNLSRTGTFTYSFYVKRSNNDWIFFTINDSFINYFNLATGQFGTTPDTCTAIDAGNGWYRITATRTLSAQNSNCGIGIANGNNGGSFTAVGTEAVFIYGAQLETGSTATAFQNIGTDKMLVCAGVRKLSDAALAVVAELSADAGTNNGAFRLLVTTGGWEYRERGTLNALGATAGSISAPITNVLSGLGDIGADSTILQINGAQAGQSTADQGTGNFGSYPLFIGARNLGSLFLTGRLYGLVVAGSQYTAGQVSATEQWMNGRTRAF